MCLTDTMRKNLVQRTAELNEVAKSADEKLRKVAEFLASSEAPRIRVKTYSFHTVDEGTHCQHYSLTYARSGGSWGLYVEKESFLSPHSSFSGRLDLIHVERFKVDQLDRSLRIQAATALNDLIKRLDEETKRQVKALQQEGLILKAEA